MSAEIQVVTATSLRGTAREASERSTREPFQIRKLLAIDERPALVAFATTLRGQIALTALFGVLLACAIPVRIAAVAVLAATAVAHLQSPRREHAVLAGTVASLFLDPVWYVTTGYEQFLAQALA